MAEVKWIKLSTDIFDNRKIKAIERMPEGDALIVIWLKLLVLAGNVNDNGLVYFTRDIPYTDQLLAGEFNRPLTVIQLALATFQKFGMIEITDELIHVSNWSKYQNTDGMEKIREQNRIRQKNWYDRKKALQLEEHNVIPNVSITQPNATDIDKNKNRLEEDKNKNTPKPDFSAIIAEYTENEELRAALDEFIKYRKSIKKPITTEYTLKQLIKGLNKLGQTDAERVEVLNQSMVNGWQGIFELKKQDKAKAEADAKQAEHDAIWAERLKRCINL